MTARTQDLTLIGYGAIGRSVHQRIKELARVRITHIVVSPARVAVLQAELGEDVVVTERVPERTPLVLLRLDVDDLQEHNDLHGQGALDAGLAWLASRVAQVVNGRGPIGRLGGDDFAVLLEGVQLPEALQLAEEVRRATARMVHASPFGDYRLTLSVGVAALRPSEPWGNLMDAAERALTRAKQAGRDTVALR